MEPEQSNGEKPGVEEPDEVLVERAKTDSAAFGVLYERYVAKIYSYTYYRTGSVADAEDLTQRTFFQALSHLSSYTHRGWPFSAWLFTIAHNQVANWHRDRQRRQTIRLDDVLVHVVEEDFLEKNQRAEMVRRLVAGLPPERQQLLLLKFAEGLPNAEIGRIMGRSEGAIKALLHRTLRSLKEKLTE